MVFPFDIGVFFKSSSDKDRPDAQIHFAPGAGKYHKSGKDLSVMHKESNKEKLDWRKTSMIQVY